MSTQDGLALRRADEAASVAHDYIWPRKEPVDAIGDELPVVTREEASAAIWTIHNALRPLLAALPPSTPPALDVEAARAAFHERMNDPATVRRRSRADWHQLSMDAMDDIFDQVVAAATDLARLGQDR